MICPQSDMLSQVCSMYTVLCLCVCVCVCVCWHIVPSLRSFISISRQLADTNTHRSCPRETQKSLPPDFPPPHTQPRGGRGGTDPFPPHHSLHPNYVCVCGCVGGWVWVGLCSIICINPYSQTNSNRNSWWRKGARLRREKLHDAKMILPLRKLCRPRRSSV